MGDLALLVALTGGTILAATWISGSRTIESLSNSLIDQTANRTETELQRFFGTVQSNVLTGRDWAFGDMLDATDHQAMNALFVPILKQHPQLSSMMVANSEGAEYLLLRDPLDPETWTNRIVQAERWGTRVLNRKWNTETGEVEEGFGELEYDPRKRIWYERALLTTTTDPVYWTEPVIFFVTKDPGITASTHIQSKSGSPQTTVVAYDLLLLDISKFTSSLEVSKNGKAFVLVEDHKTGKFQVVGLPKDARYQTDESIRDALVFVPPETAVADTDAQLPSPEKLRIPSVTAAMDAWKQHGKPGHPIQFANDGNQWWGGFRHFKLGENTFWIGVIVPERDLSSGIRLQQMILMTVVGGVLLLGLLRTAMLARRFSVPIESLVEESEQISQGNLQPGRGIKSNIDEIRRLAEAHENMREGLKSVIKLEKLERDLDLAREIQRGLLPEESPETPGFAIAGWNRPADKTGGDYFDWVTLPDGRTLFTLADVTGHGIGPALIVSVYRAYMRSTTSGEEMDLSAIVGRINELLCGDMPEDRFITAAMGIVNHKEFEVELLSAGQAPLLYFKAADDKLFSSDADDLPLGIVDSLEFANPRIIHFGPGDMLVLTTDGFFEATNSKDEQYGIEALEQFIHENHQLPPEEFIKQLYRQVNKHAAGQAQEDDLTALVIKRVVGES